MRVAVVGLGDIARKAYLPVLAARGDVELIFCTRDRETLGRLSRAYRVSEVTTDYRELPGRGVEAAFVHTSTESHAEVASELLRGGLHVHLDKPISYTYEESVAVVEAAERAGRVLAVGFNRRFAPMYAGLKAKPGRRLVLMQKNRAYLPEHPRRFVFDDFIHVADTLRFLCPAEALAERVTFFTQEGLLRHLTLHLEGDGFAAFGVMNRDSGADEEVLEVMSPGNKWDVRGLDVTTHYTGGEERVRRFRNWDTVLHRRGFPQMVEHFLELAGGRGDAPSALRDALQTHALCERIVARIEGGQRL
ncbi:MAG TPA: Gfo/Idh/MocA family oxidoreductase [Pyrinomonadaceae bacterium]